PEEIAAVVAEHLIVSLGKTQEPGGREQYVQLRVPEPPPTPLRAGDQFLERRVNPTLDPRRVGSICRPFVPLPDLGRPRVIIHGRTLTLARFCQVVYSALPSAALDAVIRW